MNENNHTPEVEIVENEVLEGEVWEADAPRELPMRWHKFVIYFSLWFSVALNILNLLRSVLLLIGEGSARYAAYPLLLLSDGISLLSMAAMIVLAMITRFALARFQKHGPKLLLLGIALNLICSCIAGILNSIALQHPLLSHLKIMRLVFGILYLILINKYYYRRRHMFAN